ncbi:aldehyde dehydrogenase family protein [Capillimicrobium parvum]|uniref:2-hydroxymuconic semialdehyde dehydrogenase n=1 Tax=Capillimicrobium parvum TaxID=2884022 RepID=A0A9E7C732_9ACTN|nr:aldehyde dehydrogenase family protein [Capillimicrobium parvum]UGS39088.1 2-hydroxymuconic semialdehyde dehydrogenase [Capillimicrobium parvum]
MTEVEGVEVPTEHYIDGHRVASADTFEVRSPIDWADWKLADVARGGAAEVDAAVAAARRAFPAWAALGPGGRHAALSRLADAIDAAVPRLAAVECVDNGSIHEAMEQRVLPRAANNVRFFADYAAERLAEPPRTLHGGERNRVRHDPAGVVAVSTPWNAPFMLATWRVGPALAAGNTVVLKPPEWAPLTCSLLGDLADEAGLPPGVLNVVHGTGAEAGAPLTGHPGVDRVAFTGSPATAHVVYRDAAAQLTPVSFELGGKSPFIVFEDADLDAAVRTAAYQFDNSGQVCLAGTRLLVQRSILDEFLERLRAAADEIAVGDPREAGTTYGPLIHPVALGRVTGHVARAREQGARLVFGGESLGGLYYAPTLFTDIPADAEILQREVFGPVLTLQAFADEAEAVALANGTDYGLAATIYTGDAARADRVSGAVVAGTVWVNCFYVRDLETPFGGARDSGIGREGGHHSFDFYCDVKTVCERTALYAGEGGTP